MNINESVLQNGEKIIFSLRELYLSYGYKLYRMSKFEEYDFYASNKEFLVSDNVITFTDTDGKLLALKPDVTLSIIKNSIDEPEKKTKVFYNENVYRVSKGTGSYKEIMQTGIECFGNIGIEDITESVILAVKSLKLMSESAVLAVSDIGIITGIVESLGLDAENQKSVYKAIEEKNIGVIKNICSVCENKDNVKLLCKLLSIHGTVKTLLPKIIEIFNDEHKDFCEITQKLSDSEYADSVYVDFSVIGDINYYNGIVFKGYLKNIPSCVLSGGQYDRLMKRLGRKSCAVGFAVYTDWCGSTEMGWKYLKTMLNVALPKGRLGEKIYAMFERAGFECPEILDETRKLIFENKTKKLRYFWVKPSDVPIYVERGAADIGVSGKDILLEYEPEVYELLDLKKGKCRMAVAAPKDFTDDPSRTLKVATKFTNIAKEYYRSKGRDIDIIHLNGSIELAPILKLSDVIVDIVETGTTLKENNLEVIETVVPISARLIANKTAYKYKYEKIKEISDSLLKITEEEQ